MDGGAWWATVHGDCRESDMTGRLHFLYFYNSYGLEEAQAGIKIAGKNINNLKYADDTTLRAES